MNNYYFKLNLDISNAFNNNWEQPFKNYHFFVEKYDEHEDWLKIFTTEFIEQLSDILPISRLMVFNKPFWWKNEDAHIDSGVLFALNIIKTKDTSLLSKMEWFEALVEDRQENFNRVNTSYIGFKPDEIKLVFSDNVDKFVSIVRTDIPHRIKIGAGDRTCFSFRFKNDLSSWPDVYKFFNDLNLIQI